MKKNAGDPVFAEKIDHILAEKIISRAHEHADAPQSESHREQDMKPMNKRRARCSFFLEILPWITAAALIVGAAMWSARRT